MGVRHFAEQVDGLLSLHRFPDITLLWIEHNNVDWVESFNFEHGNDVEQGLEELVESFTKAYRSQLRRIVAAASKAAHPTTIVVFGLINFGYFFQAREVVEARKKTNPTLYPYLERSALLFPSFESKYRKETIALAVTYYLWIKELVKEMQLDVKNNSKLLYSSALAKADIGYPESLSHFDAWHPSIRGYKTLADAAYQDIGEHVELHFKKSRKR